MGAYDKLPMMVGALSSHDREENDFYATDPISITSFLKENPPIAYKVWEPACGNGNMAKHLLMLILRLWQQINMIVDLDRAELIF